MTGMTDTQFDAACDELMDLLVEHEVCDAISASLRDRTCDLHLYDDQIHGLLQLVRAGIEAGTPPQTAGGINQTAPIDGRPIDAGTPNEGVA